MSPPEFLRALADDLRTVPVYIDDLADVPPKYRFQHAQAITASWLDLSLRDYHEGRGDWQGRGAQVVTDRAGIMAELVQDCGGDEVLADEMFDDRVRDILVHELGHVLDKGLCLADAVPARVQLSQQRLAAYCKAPPPVEPVPWVGHGLSWIRVTLHLVWRAQELGHDVALPTACNTSHYSLSPVLAYQNVLGDEPERLAHERFSTINTIDPPLPFVRLFKADVAHWKTGQEVRAARAGR